jgi:hypothetical protein
VAAELLDTIRLKRKIVAKSAGWWNAIELDAPIFNHLDLDLTTPYVAKLETGGAVARVGVEHLRVYINFNGNDGDRNHAATSIEIVGA